MNDFTKEQLEWIYEAMEDMIGADSCEPERILMKVKSMIDNYCEHGKKEVIQTQVSGILFQNKCKKCQRIV